MSRNGKKKLIVPEGVDIVISDRNIVISKGKNSLNMNYRSEVIFKREEEDIFVLLRKKNDKKSEKFRGLYRSLLNNMLIGVVTPFEKKLKLVGLGITAEVKEDKLNLNLNFSHPVSIDIPKEITVNVKYPIITVTGIDKQKVGLFVAKTRSKKPPDPYKGKGIRGFEEVVIKKQGKTGSK